MLAPRVRRQLTPIKCAATPTCQSAAYDKLVCSHRRSQLGQDDDH